MGTITAAGLGADANLKLYYPMDGNSNDSSASANNGSDTSMSYAAGNFSSAAVFSGSSSKIVSGADLGLSSTAQSFSFWFKINGEQTGLYTVFDSRQQDNTAGHTHLRVYAGSTIGTQTFRFDLVKVGTSEINATASGTWFDNAWHHCVCVRNGAQITIYIDGISRAVAGSGTTDATTDGKLVLGEKSTSDANNPLNPAMSIDDLAVFNRVLTVSEIITITGYRTFGITTVGGAADQQDGGGVVRGSKFTLSEDATITSMSLYCKVANAGTVKVKMAIYSDNGSNTPTTWQLTSDEASFTNTSLAWVTCTVTPTALSAGTYWLVWTNDGGTGTGGLWFSNSALTDGIAYVGNTYPTMPSPFGSPAYQSFVVSIYATYTPHVPSGFLAFMD